MGSWYDAPDPDSGLYPNDFDPSLDPSKSSGGGGGSDPVFGDLGGSGGGGGSDPTTGLETSGGSSGGGSTWDGTGSWYPAPDPDSGLYPGDYNPLAPPPSAPGGDIAPDVGHTEAPGHTPATPAGGFGTPTTGYGGQPIPDPQYGNAKNDILSLAKQAWDPIYNFTGGNGGSFYSLQGNEHGMDSWGNYQLQVGPDPRKPVAAGADGKVPQDASGHDQTYVPFDPFDPLQVTVNESYLREGLRPWYSPAYLPRNPIRPAGSLF